MKIFVLGTITLAIASILIYAPGADAKARCRDTGARMISPAIPEYPQEAKAANLGPQSVVVAVSISASGKVTKAVVHKSSTNAVLDAEALRAARESTYSPATKNCRRIAGTYAFMAKFDPSR